MGTQKLKAAVISAGMIANSGHIPAYKAFSQDVSLEAVCDLNASAARDTALRHDIPRWYSDVAAMLEEVHPDLVSVCTPNSTHKGLVAQALKAGANVICEKPLSITPIRSSFTHWPKSWASSWWCARHPASSVPTLPRGITLRTGLLEIFTTRKLTESGAEGSPHGAPSTGKPPAAVARWPTSASMRWTRCSGCWDLRRSQRSAALPATGSSIPSGALSTT